MYISLRTSDVYENKSTKVTFNPIKTQTENQGEEFLIIKNTNTKEEIKITLSDFRNHYNLIETGSLNEKSFFI